MMDANDILVRESGLVQAYERSDLSRRMARVRADQQMVAEEGGLTALHISLLSQYVAEFRGTSKITRRTVHSPNCAPAGIKVMMN